MQIQYKSLDGQIFESAEACKAHEKNICRTKLPRGTKVKFEWYMYDGSRRMFSGEIHSKSDYACPLKNECIYIVKLDDRFDIPFLVAINSSCFDM